MLKLKEGRIPDTAKHKLMVKTKFDSGNKQVNIFSHTMMCVMHGLVSGDRVVVHDYQAFYFSMSRPYAMRLLQEMEDSGETMYFETMPLSYSGVRFAHVNVPASLRALNKVLDEDRFYFGFTNMGTQHRPETFALNWVKFTDFVDSVLDKATLDAWHGH